MQLLLALSVAVVAFALLISRSHARSLGFYGAGSWFLLFYSAFVMYGYVSNYVSAGMPGSGPNAEGLLVATIGLLFVTLGVVVSQRAGATATSGNRVMVNTTDRDLLIMGIVVLVPSWLYFILLGNVPLFSGLEALSRSGSEGLGALQLARLERDPYVNADAAYVPMQGLLETFRNVGTPALFAATILRWRANGYRFRYLVIASTAVITVMAAGQKWPFQYLLFATIFALGLASGKLATKTLLAFGSWGVVLAALLSVMQGRSGGATPADLFSQITAGIGAVLDRTFRGYVETSILSYAYSGPDLHNLGGASYAQSLLAYVPGFGQSYAVDFYRIVYDDHRGFTAPPDFSTELFINWGMIGVLLGGAIWGATLAFVDHVLAKRQYSPEAAGLVAITFLSFAAVTTSGLLTSLRAVFVVVPVVVAIRFWGGQVDPLAASSRRKPG